MFSQWWFVSDTHTSLLTVRWAALEGKFLETHLYHCFLYSSCVRSLCCLNTMGSGKSQHLSDRHSIIVTAGTDNKRHKCSLATDPIFRLLATFMMVLLRSKMRVGFDWQSKCPGYVTFCSCVLNTVSAKTDNAVIFYWVISHDFATLSDADWDSGFKQNHKSSKTK